MGQVHLLATSWTGNMHEENIEVSVTLWTIPQSGSERVQWHQEKRGECEVVEHFELPLISSAKGVQAAPGETW